MSLKRRNTSSPECESPVKKRNVQPLQSYSHDGYYDNADEIETNERPSVNAYTGQAGAFPGLADSGEEVFYGPANDGLDYLRMVRSEAKGIPHLLRAQVDGAGFEKLPDEQDGDDGYWDEDGTYTARPAQNDDTTANALSKAQIEYHDSLLRRFVLVRATLKCVPPLSAIEQLTSSQPITFPSESKNAQYSWSQCLKTRYPNPAQIACMDQDSVLNLIRFMTAKLPGLFRSERYAKSTARMSTWIWAALGKCPDRGELGSEEVSDLRQLAHKALDTRDWLDKSNRRAGQIEAPNQSSTEPAGPLNEAGEELSSDADTDEMTGESQAAQAVSEQVVRIAEQVDRDIKSTTGAEVLTDEIETAKRRLGESVQRSQMDALVDMILTVVGDVYGQRDLLELRSMWPNE